VRHNLTAVAWEPWQLDELEGAAHKAGLRAGSLPVHLEIEHRHEPPGLSLDGCAGSARFHPSSRCALRA